MKLLKTMLILSFTSLALCACSSDAPAGDPQETIVGTYCVDFSLVGSELTISQNTDGTYTALIEDHDGGLRSGSGIGQLDGSNLSVVGTFDVEFGTGNMLALLNFGASSVIGQLSILDPTDTPIVTSSIKGTKGACNHSLAPADIASVLATPVLTDLHIELSKVKKVSRYRSAAGHNFVDYSGESCVNLKHYYLTYSEPQSTNAILPSSLDYYAPASGTIVTLTQARPSVDATDYEMDIRLDANPNIIVRIFHLTPQTDLTVGSHVTSGDLIGSAPEDHRHSGDLAVYIMTNDGYRHVSAFELMTPEVLSFYEARGVDSSNWKNDLYYETNDPYVSGIYCENVTWGNLRHPNNNYLDDLFLLN